MKQLLHWSIRLPLSVLSHWAASSAFRQPIKLPWQQSEVRGCGMAWRNAQWLCGNYKRNQFSDLPLCGKNVYKWDQVARLQEQPWKPVCQGAAQRQAKNTLIKRQLLHLFFHLTILQTQQCCHNHNFGPFSANFILLSLSFAWDCDAVLYIKPCK